MTDNLQEKLSSFNLDLLKSLSFIIYELENNSKNDLFMLSKLLDEDSLTKIIDYYNGSTLTIPTKEEYKMCSLLSLFFYLTEIKEMSFSQAKEFIKKNGNVELEFSEQTIGRRLNKVKEKLKIKILELIENP